jgi:hypothetical protein
MLEINWWERGKPDFGIEFGTPVLKIGLYGVEENWVCCGAFCFLAVRFLPWFKALSFATRRC